jgi:hypothetical protein
MANVARDKLLSLMQIAAIFSVKEKIKPFMCKRESKESIGRKRTIEIQYFSSNLFEKESILQV